MSPSPRVPGPRPTRGEEGAAAFIARKARALDASLAKAIRRVMTNADAEALHDMRVAIRRLRTVLRLARPVYGRYRTTAVRRAFTQVQAKTGELRDEEALAETLDGLSVDDPAFIEWRARRRAREKRLRAAVISRLRAGDLTRARRLLHALLLLPVRPSRDAVVGRFARRTVNRARKKVEAMRDVPTSDVELMHELRIRYKELRYSAETFAEVLPLDLAALAPPAARFQKRLGDIHDIDTALDALSRARGLPPETSARVAAALVELRARKARKYLDDMSPTPSLGEASEPAASVQASPHAVGGVVLRKISTF
jgi:CHAD domain-containing protein